MLINAPSRRVSHDGFSFPKALYWHAAVWLVLVLMAWGLWLRLSGQDALWMQAVHAVPPTHWGLWFWSCLTNLGMGWAMLTVVMACDRRDGALIALLLPVFVLGSLLTHGLKQALEVTRPASSGMAEQLFFIGEPVFSASSTPSGHALAAAALAMILAWWAKNALASALLAAAALLVAWSRVVVGAHWPADVFLGLALGACTVVMVLALSQLPLVRKPLQGLRHQIASPSGQLVVACLEMACAMALASTRTGYPQGWPAVVWLVSVALVSGLWRCHRVLQQSRR